MRLYLLLGLGGIAGVTLRFALGEWLGSPASSGFPVVTLLINVSGSFLLGFLMRFLVESATTREVKIMLTSGFCGGFTTFSTFSYETLLLLSDRRYSTAALYGTTSLVASVVACWAGFLLAEMVAVRR